MVKSNILLIIPNMGLGGAQRVFTDHARLLASQYNVTECIFNLDLATNYHTENELYELKVSGGGGALFKIKNFIARCKRLKEYKHVHGIAVSISHLEGADYVNILSGVGERKVLCIHGSKLHDRNIKGLLGWIRQRLLIPILYRRADKIVTVSQGIQFELVHQMGLPASKVQVINNFFDEATLIQQASMALPAPYGELLANYPTIVTACRFAPEKNLIALLELFYQTRKRIPLCKLLLIGHGEQYDDLINHCRTLSLPVYTPDEGDEVGHTAAVLLVGFQSNPHAFIARATVFVLPSLNEGFPMALGEAMVCGCPIVAADCPTGPREILAPATATPIHPLRQAERAKYGYLLPVINNPITRVADEQVWVNTLTDLLADPAEQKRLKHLSRERMQDFTREKISNQWIQLVEELLN